MSDDRFEKDSTVYKPAPRKEELNAMDFFLESFELGMGNSENVKKLAEKFPRVYAEALKRFQEK